MRRPILIIDDDPHSRELVTAILTGADFEILLAADGPSGIELALTAQPVVIILDMMMPDMDGISTLQRMKRDPVLKDIPVVGITASSDLTYTEKAFRSGAQFFLTKPFRASSLLRAVELASDFALRGEPMHRRRCHPRHPAELLVSCLLREDEARTSEITGKTGNISLGGLLLLLPKTVAPGTPVQLGLALPEGSITATGRVMWQHPKPVDEGNYHHGVRLLGFAQDTSSLLYRRYVGQLSEVSTS